VARVPMIIERRADWVLCSLLSWQNETEGVGRLVHSLKGARAPKKFLFFAKLLTRKLFLHSTFGVDLKKNLIFVPAPARNVLEHDHAFLFATALAECMGGQVKPLLQRESLEEQKGLDLAARKKTRLLNNTSSLNLDDEMNHIFFVDDLVVSGSTAQAAYLALKKPKYFTVLTIATRPRLQNLMKVAINSDA
jgi:predicted amidophosphoribosyltransferase